MKFIIFTCFLMPLSACDKPSGPVSAVRQGESAGDIFAAIASQPLGLRQAALVAMAPLPFAHLARALSQPAGTQVRVAGRAIAASPASADEFGDAHAKADPLTFGAYMNGLKANPFSLSKGAFAAGLSQLFGRPAAAGERDLRVETLSLLGSAALVARYQDYQAGAAGGGLALLGAGSQPTPHFNAAQRSMARLFQCKPGIVFNSKAAQKIADWVNHGQQGDCYFSNTRTAESIRTAVSVDPNAPNNPPTVSAWRTSQVGPVAIDYPVTPAPEDINSIRQCVSLAQQGDSVGLALLTVNGLRNELSRYNDGSFPNAEIAIGSGPVDLCDATTWPTGDTIPVNESYPFDGQED